MSLTCMDGYVCVPACFKKHGECMTRQLWLLLH